MENSGFTPALPLVPGLTWQAITLDHLSLLVQLANECHLVDGGLGFLNQPDNLKERYFPVAPGISIGAFDGHGSIVACTSVHLIHDSGTERVIIVGQVRPEFRNKGIGAYLMRWSRAQAYKLFTPATIDKRLLEIRTESLTEPAQRLYRRNGFESVFEELVMRRDLFLPLPDHPFPQDVTVVTWEPALAGQFFQAYHAAFRERPGFPGYSAQEWISRRNEDENAISEWSLLARVGNMPVGFVHSDKEHPDAYISQIGVIPEQRRRGLASALLVESMRRMQADGETAAQLVVHINNPGAIQTYARLGFVTRGRRARYERVLE